MHHQVLESGKVHRRWIFARLIVLSESFAVPFKGSRPVREPTVDLNALDVDQKVQKRLQVELLLARWLDVFEHLLDVVALSKPLDETPKLVEIDGANMAVVGLVKVGPQRAFGAIDAQRFAEVVHGLKAKPCVLGVKGARLTAPELLQAILAAFGHVGHRLDPE